MLGDMLELGKHTKNAHEHIGQVVKENVDVLVVVGQRAKDIKEGSINAGMDSENVFDFQNAHEAGEFLKDFIKKNDFVFVKGSQGMRMERTVEQIMEEKDKKSELLVRQEKEWLER